MNPLKLTEIRRQAESGLLLTWNDGSRFELSYRLLRTECPCAECREARGDSSHAKPLTSKKNALRVIDASADEQLKLTEIWAVGNYAIGLAWGDGHKTGIYTFELLRALCERTRASETTTVH